MLSDDQGTAHEDEPVDSSELRPAPGPFLLLAGNQAFLDGKRSRPCFGPGTIPASLVLSVLVLALFAVPLFFLIGELLQLNQLRSLRQQGQRVEAVVVELHQESSRIGKVCSVAYSYRLPGQTKAQAPTDGHDDVAQQFCALFEDHNPDLCTPRGLHPCDRGAVMVLIDPKNPKVTRIDHDPPKTKLWVSLGASIGTGTIVGLVAILILRGWLRFRTLGAKGKRLPGTVKSARVAKAGTNKIDLNYIFQNPEAQDVEGRVKELWDRPVGTPPPMPGTPLVVLYVNDNLQKVL